MRPLIKKSPRVKYVIEVVYENTKVGPCVYSMKTPNSVHNRKQLFENSSAFVQFNSAVL